MTIREELEALEHTQLDRRAAFADETVPQQLFMAAMRKYRK